MLTFKHSKGVFTYPNPKALSEPRYFEAANGVPARIEMNMPDGSVERLSFDTDDDAQRAVQIIQNAIFPEPNYGNGDYGSIATPR